MRRPLLALLVLVCASASLRPCAAQIRVPRPRVPNPLDRVTGANSGTTRAPTFDDRVVEITDARITALVRGLEAERRQRPALETGYRKNADDRAAYEVARRGAAGREEQVSNCTANSPEYRQVMGDTGAAGQAAQMALMNRVQALQAKGDYAAIQAIGDSVARIAMKRDSLLTAARTRCEAIPAPKAPTGPPPAEPSRPLGDSLQVLGAGAAGMSAEQYAVMRERVLAYLSVDESELRGSLWAFSGNELAALRARKPELLRYRETLAAE